MIGRLAGRCTVRVAAMFLVTLATAGVVDAGAVFVQTQPPTPDARVELDDRVLATTGTDGSAYIENLPPGVRRFTLVTSDGRRVDKEITVASGDIAGRLVFEVAGGAPPAATGELVMVMISGNVGSATVRVDGQVVGVTGAGDASLMVELPAGRHTIELGAPDYVPEKKVVELKPGPVGRLLFELQRQKSNPASRSSSVLNVALVAILGIAVIAVVAVAVVVVRRSSTERITTRRLDRYEMREIIGRGGMATVYRATDATSKDASPVALKVLDAVHLEDADLVRKFLREGEVLKRLAKADPDAPLVEVFHYGRAGGSEGRPFIAMELLNGEDLLKHLKRRGRVPLKDAVRIVKGVARALQPAHAAGIYHRDLTPDNVILVTEPKGGHHLRLIDFGVARHEYTSHGTLDGSIAGKPPYMSPEQCQGIAVDGRSDIYALGVMLFALLTGAPPFTHTNPLEVMRMHKEEEVSYPSSVPDPAARFLRRTLAKNRDDRYLEIVSFMQGLERIERSA